ncbi:MAG: Mur ligase family protein [Oscillospiraceae bacterium]
MANGKLEALLAEWRRKRLLILGLGVSNRPLARHCCWKPGAGLRAATGRTGRSWTGRSLDLEEQGLELRLGAGYLENLEADVVFRTPGMHPANPALEALRRRGAAVTSEMEIFFQVCPCPVIAVTGSDGKTTTTTLLAEMLRAAGKTVWVGGTLASPFCRRWGAWPPRTGRWWSSAPSSSWTWTAAATLP